MKHMKKAICFIMIILIAIGACGCMNDKKALMRKENDTEYSDLMLNYITNKYNKNFTVVETFFPQEGLNSTMKVNTLVVRENENDILVNVYALLAKPYDFYDNYEESYSSYLAKDKIDSSIIDSYATSKLYVYLNELDVNDVDLCDENINKTTLVVNINDKPSDAILKDLYEVYKQLTSIKSKYMFMIVGFTEKNDIYTKYTMNFSYYGDKSWEDYSGEVYATMKITDRYLSYEAFVDQCKKRG